MNTFFNKLFQVGENFLNNIDNSIGNTPPNNTAEQKNGSNNNNNSNDVKNTSTKQPTTKNNEKKQVVDELDQFIQSMNLNKSQSDLDLMILLMNDKITKMDYENAYSQLKHFVYITIEGLHKHCTGDMADANSTYGTLQQSYLLPTLNKLEDFYQLIKNKAEEASRSSLATTMSTSTTAPNNSNSNEQNVLILSLMVSILQQLRIMLVKKRHFDSQQDEDEGQIIYTNYHAKNILNESHQIVKDILRVNQQILPTDTSLANRIKIVQHCFTSLQRILSMVVQRLRSMVTTSDKQWAWNTTILEKNRKIKLKSWDTSRFPVPLHNQSSMYLDQIYTILIDRLKDNQLVNQFNDANNRIEDIIMRFESNQPFIDSIQYLLGVDQLVDELSAISDISFKYSNYIEQISNKKLVEMNKFKSRIQEIMNTYITLETQYFQLSFSLAIYMDDLGQMLKNLKNQQQLPQQQQQIKGANDTKSQSTSSSSILPSSITTEKTIKDIDTSSKVEEIFFIFQKVVTRSILTNSAPSVCATINLTSTNFDTLYIPYMEILLKQSYIGDFEEKRDYFLVILNDFSLTSNYVSQMQEEMKLKTQDNFKNQDDIKMIETCINGEGFNSLKTRMQSLLNENIEKIFKNLQVPINQIIWPFNNINYEINDQDYERYEINDPFVQDFMYSLDSLLKPYKVKLVDDSFDKLIHFVSGHVAITLEEHILNNKQKKFNLLGSIQLSKDIKQIIDHLCHITTSQNIRHKFARLSQITHLLTLDKVTDVLEYWGQEGYVWRLTVLEIKLILARRSDFPLQSVHNLVLK